MGTSDNVVEENNANPHLSKNDYKNRHNKNFKEKSLLRHLQIFSINDLTILMNSQQLKVNVEESVCCCQNTVENPSEDIGMSETQETPVLKSDIEPIKCAKEDCENAGQGEHFESIADHPVQPSTPESEITASATSATLGRSPQGKAAPTYQNGCHKDRGRGSFLTVASHIYFKLAFWVCLLALLVDSSKAERLNSSYGLQQCDVPKSDLVFRQDRFCSFGFLISDKLQSVMFWCTCVVFVVIAMVLSKRLFFKMCRFIQKLLAEIRLYCHQSQDIQHLDTEEDTYKSQYTPSAPIEASQSIPKAYIEDENQKQRETHTLISPTPLQVISPEAVPADSSSLSSTISIKKPPSANVGKSPSELPSLSIQESSGDHKSASLIVSLDGTHSMDIFNHPPAENVWIPAHLLISSPQSSSSMSSQVPVASKEWGANTALTLKTFNCVVENSSSSTELSFSDISDVTAAEAVLPSCRCPYTFH